jgi:hypothetical protein
MSEINSLIFLRAVYCNEGLPLSVRMRAAGMALPFEHPKLMAVAVSGENGFAAMLEQRLRRRQEMKLIEATPVAKVEHSPDELKHVEAVPDRRFKRRV